MASPLDDVSLSSILRYGRDRLGRIAGEVPNEIAAGYRDLANVGKEVVRGMTGREPFVDALRQQMKARALRGDDYSSMSETPFGTHTSSDPAVQLAGAALDPANLIGTGVGAKLAMAAGGIKKGAKREGALINLKLRERDPHEALALALRESHLVPRAAEDVEGVGRYVGGPRNIESRQQLAANRRRMDRELSQATRELEAAGEQPGDWYPSQKRGVAEIADPWQQRRAAEETAIMSSQTDPHGERGFMVQAHNRLARGEPVGVVHTGRQGTEFERSAIEGRPMKLGEKTGVYAVHSDPTVSAADPLVNFGTNDFRQAQYHGYTEPSGKPQTTGLKPTQHAFMDAETMLLTNRARSKALGGREDWTGAMAQEVPWIVEKGDALQKRYPGRFPRTPEGRRAALQEAAKTGEDFNKEFAAGATYERIPGAGTGHDPGIVSAPFNERLEYSREAPWTSPTGRDVIYEGQGLLQRPTTEGVGIWEGATNPNFVAQPLADIVSHEGGRTRATSKAVPGGRAISTGMQKQLALGENLRGLVDVQDASVAHIPMTQAARKSGTKTHILMEHDTPLSEAETRALEQAAPGYSPTPTPRGTLLMQWDKPSSQVARDVEQLRGEFGDQLPMQRAGMEGTGLLPIYKTEGGEYLPHGQGIATSNFLRRAAESPEASVLGMSESEGVRGAIGRIHARDAQRELAGATIRPDVQATRRFLSEADWARAAALIRKGMTPAAAVAALGYSLSGMAAEPEVAK